MKDYQKYKWFYTNSEKLVVGGKNAEQNEELLKKFKELKEDRIVMHTAQPGSPFSIIVADIDSIKSQDIEEAAIFTASFSQEWKKKKKTSEIHIFNLSQLYKLKAMKAGTWGVKGKIKKITVPLSLVLTKQKSKLRAVPESSAKSFFLKIIPGNIDKQQMVSKLQEILPSSFSKEDILSALPAGGLSIK